MAGIMIYPSSSFTNDETAGSGKPFCPSIASLPLLFPKEVTEAFFNGIRQASKQILTKDA